MKRPSIPRLPLSRIPKFWNWNLKDKIKKEKFLIYDFDSKNSILTCKQSKVAIGNTTVIALRRKIIEVVYRKDGEIKALSKPRDEMDYPDTSDFEAIKKTIESMRDSDILPALADAENNISESRHWMEMLLPMLPILTIVVSLVA